MPSHLNAVRNDIIALLPRLRRFARQLTRSDGDADDVVAEACQRALTDLDRWDRDQPFDRWVIRITCCCCLTKRKQRHPNPRYAGGDGWHIDDFRTDPAFAGNSAGRDLQSSVRALPPDLAAALLAVAGEGYSYAEAADLLEIPKDALMRRVHTARKLLADGPGGTNGALRKH